MMSQPPCGAYSSAGNDFSSVGGGGDGAEEIVLFGVRVKVDPMRKSVSMNNLTQYEQPAIREPSNNNLDSSALAAVVAADTGYASADDAVRNLSSGGRERKRGVPWTEEEHKLFLLGLQKVGKGDWRGISRNFVKTRTPTQVASHAQKYFLRRSNLNRRRRRSSLFDITTDTVATMPMEEEQVHDHNKVQPVSPPPMTSSQPISPLSGFPLAAFPVGPVLSSPQIENPVETINFNNGDQVNMGSTFLVLPIPMPQTPNPPTRVDLNLNQKYETETSPSPLSLNLSLSYDHNQSSQRHSSTFQVISGFNNGDGMISVA